MVAAAPKHTRYGQRSCWPDKRREGWRLTALHNLPARIAELFNPELLQAFRLALVHGGEPIVKVAQFRHLHGKSSGADGWDWAIGIGWEWGCDSRPLNPIVLTHAWAGGFGQREDSSPLR